MNKRAVDLTAPFLPINEAARVSGMSRTFIRRGVQQGTIAHIRSGTTYMICMTKFLAALEDAAEQNTRGGTGGEQESATVS